MTKSNPDYLYDKDYWDNTYAWSERDTLTDNLCIGDIMECGTLIEGPTVFFACIQDEDGFAKVVEFATEEEAEAAAEEAKNAKTKD